MSNKATLVVMAAGMGSRYGGTKQIDPIDSEGHTIMDFSIFDAVRAGFDKIVFVVKQELTDYIESTIGAKVRKHAEVQYAYQKLETLPAGYKIPKDRVKPWGTGHAALCAMKYVDSPFAVINSDDFYGRHAYEMAYDYIVKAADNEHCMVGYKLKNTVTENGYVSRGVCTTDELGYLDNIQEVLHIENREDGIAYLEEESEKYIPISGDTLVSLNMWGFGKGFAQLLKKYFPVFLDENLSVNPLKCEYFLPSVVEKAILHDGATVKVLPTEDRWFGVTYKEDKQMVMDAVENLKNLGEYPTSLWR